VKITLHLILFVCLHNDAAFQATQDIHCDWIAAVPVKLKVFSDRTKYWDFCNQAKLQEGGPGITALILPQVSPMDGMRQ
jgi:hypothetical protein